jgi:hypothetical protein
MVSCVAIFVWLLGKGWTMTDPYQKWNQLAPLGLLLTGLGLSLTGDATLRKAQGKAWVLKGTLGLICFNAGLALFAESVKARMHYERDLQEQLP